MAYRYKLPCGDIIEVDSAREMRELLQLLQKNSQPYLQHQSIKTSLEPSETTLNKHPETSVSSLSNTISSRYPSVQDFLALWASLETEKSRNVMRLFARYGQKGLTSQHLAQYLEVKRASGIMSGINRQSERIGFEWKRWFPLNNGVYEPDPTAYENLKEAIAVVEAQQFE